MNSATIFLIFFISFVLGIFAVKGVEILVERRKAYKRYIKHLETENKYYRQKAYFYKLELETKEA